ncbi:MAG: substrate-binding domain-containing protein [Caldilineaceae bacterium]|nr:substrate-binding domain-containing protein [Caldilineaceae bacterium]
MAVNRGTIGFITLESTHSYISQLWLGANDCTAQLDLNLITFGGYAKYQLAETDTDQLADHIHNLIDVNSLTGLLVWTAGILQDHTMASQFLARYCNIPLVSLGVATPGIPHIVVDNYQGMSKLLTHLITHCGRRKLAFITGTPTNRDAQVRLRAYSDVLQQHGIPVKPELIVPGAFLGWDSRVLGRQAVDELFDRRGVQPDAIVASSDDLAIGVLQRLSERGIRVPEEISVTGFDNIPDCLSVYPPLTTIAQPSYELAWRGMELLAALIARQPVPEETVISTELIIRTSCHTQAPLITSTIMPITVHTTSLPTVDTVADIQTARQVFLAQATALCRTWLLNTFARKQGHAGIPTTAELEEIVTQFEAALRIENPTPFLAFVQQLIHQSPKKQDPSHWRYGLVGLLDLMVNTVTTASPSALPPLAQKNLLYLCQIMHSHLQFLLEQAENIFMRSHYLQEKELLEQLQATNRKLLIPYDPEHLAAIFTEQLPRLGIELAYVAVRKEIETVSDEVHLIIAYDRLAGQIETPENQHYKAAQLASGQKVIGRHRVSLVLAPLYSANIYAGFVLFSFGPRFYQFYTQLGNALGYSIVNSYLLEQLRHHAHQLEEKVEERTADLTATNAQLEAEINERKRVEAELEQARDQALEASRLKSEFLATMSHEIRTPMNGVVGMTELLMETELDAEQLEYARIAQEESYKLLDIINSILDFSKIEAGKIVLNEVDFDPAAEVESVVRLLAPKTQQKGIRLRAIATTKLPQQVTGDATRVHQILMNLIGNAVKFTETGGIVVSSACFPQTSLEQNSPPNARFTLRLQITVSDTGIGMSESTLQNLFQSFSQGDSSTTRRYGGSGLGLAITQRLVEFMGGTIQVDSELGIGSQFVVTLPCRCTRQEYYQFVSPGKELSAPPINHAPAPAEKKGSYPISHQGTAIQLNETPPATMLVLVAEDYTNNQRVAVAHLQKLGYTAHVVENGQAAVEAITQEAGRYGLVLMDWQMPIMDGLAATQAIRQAEVKTQRHIPIIGMTANAIKGDRERCLAAGMDDYLSKPIRRDELQRILAQWIPTD